MIAVAADRAPLDQRARADQPGIVPLGSAGVVRHDPVEVPGVGDVVADPAGGAELGQGRADPVVGQAGRLGQRGDVDRRIQESRAPTSSASSITSSLASASNAAPSPENPRYGSGERVSDSRKDPVSSSHVLGTAGEPARTAGPYTRRVRACRSSPRSAASRPAPARQTAPGVGREVRRRVRPAGTAHSTERSLLPGNRRRNAVASAAGISARGSKPAVSTCTSAKPRIQRPGSGTFRSTTAPSMVETVRSSGPTARCNGSMPPTRARASRSGGLTSTFVVPCPAISPSKPAGSTSIRAYTPQQPEKDSNRSRSRLPVTTGSRLAGLTGWW